jgi:hypothetical protein
LLFILLQAIYAAFICLYLVNINPEDDEKDNLFDFFIGLMQNVFAGDELFVGYYNNTQNYGESGGSGSYNVAANYGDTVVLKLSAFCISNYFPNAWYFNSGIIPNTAGIGIISTIITQTGVYTATLPGCFYGFTAHFYVSNITGIASIQNINFLKVFPTAVTSSITIQLNSTKINDVEISFYDVNGKQLKDDFYKNVFGELIKNENTEALAKGIYFVKIKAGDEVMEKKFVKM